MTRVEMHLRLPAPPDDKALAGISEAHSVYGILRIRLLNPSELIVEYDATRLRPGEVRSVLAAAGIRVEPK